MASLTIIFEKLQIHDDSDNFGPGSFTFSFKVNGQEIVVLKRQQEKHSHDFFDLTKWPNNSTGITLSGGEKLIISADITEHDSGATFGNDRASNKVEFDPRSFPRLSTTSKQLRIQGEGIDAELFFSVQSHIAFPSDFVLYEHVNFEGNFQVLRMPTSNTDNHLIDIETLRIGNDIVSSVELPVLFNGSRSKMVLFEDARAGGAFLELSNSHSNLDQAFFWKPSGIRLQKVKWNDNLSSVRIMLIGKEIRVYEDRCYGGRFMDLGFSNTNLYVRNFRKTDLLVPDDSISSITIPNKNLILVLFEENDAKGASLIVTQDVAELRNHTFTSTNGETLGWHDRASSLRIIRKEDRVIFFNQPKYGGDYFDRVLPHIGESIVINLKDFAVGSNNLKSLVWPDLSDVEITIYDWENKKGRALKLDPNMNLTDFSTLEKDFDWSKKVSSVEIQRHKSPEK